ncbi:MAG: signal transduction histidine kinase [Acidimicrobiales bacterium]|jgi:signal transduction histidine kinase
MNMHKTLERQLIRLYGSVDQVPPECQKLVVAVSQTYDDYESEYQLIERSLDISSAELTELNILLQKEIEIENKLTEKLRKEAKKVEEKVKLRTHELFLERAKLEKIAQNMQTGAILLDSSGEVVFINGPARKFIDYYEEGYVGSLKSLNETFFSYPVEEYLKRSLEGEALEINDAQIKNSIFNVLFQTLTDKHGTTGVLVWIDNITEERLLDRSKSELVTVASHQLRTPLTITKGNTELLLDESFGPLNEEQRLIIEQTAASNENMITLVNQMLDIAKIEQGEFAFKVTDVQIDTILEKVIKDLSSYAKEKKMVIQYNPTDKKIPLIKGDDTRLYQVFQNLIDNALKYTRPEDDGCFLVISTDVTATSVRITIRDQGIGIPRREHEKIFGRFYRATNAETLVIDGTGLGLHIVQTIVESLGGTIRFVSVENKGTIFTVTFPIELAE